jgi:transcriptional regulator with XRE-family HTH domain
MANEPRVSFNTQLMAEDMVIKGLNKLDLAQRAGVADMTVIRFLRGESQTARTAKKLARALGRPVERYIVSAVSPSDDAPGTLHVDDRRAAAR